jgi:hypothetical protein
VSFRAQLKVKPFPNPLDWADAANYRYEKLETIDSWTSFRPFTGIANIDVALSVDKSLESNGINAIFCEDVFVLVWNWGDPSLFANYRFFLISRSGGIYCEPPSHDQIWLKYFGEIFNPGVEQNTYEIKMKLSAETVSSIYGRTQIFCAGGLHFGHWFQDTLPLILYSNLQFSRPIFFSPKLPPKYKEYLLAIRETTSPFFEFQEVDLKDRSFKAFHFESLVLISGLSIKKKTEIVRHSLSQNRRFEDCKQTFKPSDRIYFKRGEVNGQRRIMNESEIIRALDHFNFNTNSVPEEMSAEKMIGLCREASLFIVPNSSSQINFGYFAPLQSKMIMLMTTNLLNYSYETAIGSSYYLLPWLDRTSVLLFPPHDRINPYITAPISIDLKVLLDEVQLIENYTGNMMNFYWPSFRVVPRSE